VSWNAALLTALKEAKRVLAGSVLRRRDNIHGRPTLAGLQESRHGLPSFHVYVMAIDPTDSTTLYAGTELFGVYRSTNGGDCWLGRE
jgi:hypothetical protein